jgi:hypothetical protein
MVYCPALPCDLVTRHKDTYKINFFYTKSTDRRQCVTFPLLCYDEILGFSDTWKWLLVIRLLGIGYWQQFPLSDR